MRQVRKTLAPSVRGRLSKDRLSKDRLRVRLVQACFEPLSNSDLGKGLRAAVVQYLKDNPRMAMGGKPPDWWTVAAWIRATVSEKASPWAEITQVSESSRLCLV